MTRNALSSLSWRPAELRLVPGPSRRSYGLGLTTNNLLVEVVDHSGRPVKGAVVQFGGEEKETDSNGLAGFSAMGSASGFEVKATYSGLTVGKIISADDISNGYTAFLQFPVCFLGPLIRPIDLLIFGTAGGMIAAGSYWKLKPLEMTGEIALGAALFGLIYRLQCL